MIYYIRKNYYLLCCDSCHKYYPDDIEATKKITNRAQAARSVGWSFGKDGKVKCKSCRQNNLFDRYR